jgi:WS/DGAT/MGAT family acyltransferase
MPSYRYDRLSAQDLTFLLAEDEHSPMHVGAIAIVEAEPLFCGGDSVDIAGYRRSIESVLHWIPRYRQKLDYVPLEGWPVWVDDRHFDLGYHIRHIALPSPGTLEQLNELSARILARHLDRRRPLWELWVIEGLHDGEQVALLNKVHHCMIDGAAGADLSQILLSPSARVEDADPLPYYPRPAPSGLELLEESLRGRLAAPRRLLETLGGWLQPGEEALVSRAELAARSLRDRAMALGSFGSWALKPASGTPINGELTPHRRLGWLTMPLDDVREVRRALGCTINDVVLTIVTGALRRYFFRRRVDPATLDFRISAPVNVRRDEHANKLGNHVSSWILPLPLDLPEPFDQLEAIRARTTALKESKSSLAIETLMAAAEYLPVRLLERGVSLAKGPVNMIVTNVPGPQFPLYARGARLLGMYPVVPLMPGSGLGVALFSYEGKLCWGFNADYELVPNLPDFVADVRASFEELRAAVASGFVERRTTKKPDTHERGSSAPAEDPPNLHVASAARRGGSRAAPGEDASVAAGTVAPSLPG